MHTVQSPLTIADYCAAMGRGEIVPNTNYQRSDKVWPPAAKSFFVESILLGFPIPKIFLFQITDLKSKKTIKEIVDGQQRSRTILDFFHNKLKLGQQLELESARGKTYEKLDPELQEKFLNYQLSIDLFLSVSPAEIRQAFRRLNSYTVPLNPEELRHAEFQGELKWFIYQLSRDYEEGMLSMGVLTAKQIVRMQDTKLLAECIHAIMHGIRTTKANDLNKLYRDCESEFPSKEDTRARIEGAMNLVLGLPEIHNSALMKPFVFYSLIVAIIHSQQPVPALQDLYAANVPFVFNRDIVVTNLTALADSITTDTPDKKYESFVAACDSHTNVDKQRKTRVQWLARALGPVLL